jgi:membrane-bound inhibitor of C-type lysozyme
MKKKNLIAIGIVILSILVLTIVIRTPIQSTQNEVVVEESGTEKAYVFMCPDGQVVQAMFEDDMALVLLPGGTPELLNIAISASGARYTNQDESLVFWNKGNTVMVEENGVMTYVDCVSTE